MKQAELYVLYKTTCPSVLTEIGFISNPTEEAFMLSEEGQAKIAICLFNAFMTYKATEEGSNRIANPVIRIKGYKAPTEAAPEKKEPAPAVADATPEPEVSPESVPSEREPKVEPKPEPKPEPTVADEAPAKTSDKPVPTVEMPRKEEPKPNPSTPNNQSTPIEQPKPEPKPEPAPAPQAPAVALQAPNNTATSDDQYFTVQFLTAPTQLKAGDPQLKGVSEFETTKKGNIYAFTTGRFATRQEAVAYCKHLKEATKSFKDAWVLNYKKPQEPQTNENTPNNQNTPNTPSNQNTPSTPTTQTTSQPAPTTGLTYRVQFMSASRVMKVGDPDLQGIKDFRYAQNGNLYVYTAGNYSTLAEARKRCAEIRKKTRFRDAFVVAFDQSGERVSVH